MTYSCNKNLNLLFISPQQFKAFFLMLPVVGTLEKLEKVEKAFKFLSVPEFDETEKKLNPKWVKRHFPFNSLPNYHNKTKGSFFVTFCDENLCILSHCADVFPFDYIILSQAELLKQWICFAENVRINEPTGKKSIRYHFSSFLRDLQQFWRLHGKSTLKLFVNLNLEWLTPDTLNQLISNKRKFQANKSV